MKQLVLKRYCYSETETEGTLWLNDDESLIQLFEAATNVAVTAADRMDTLRRFT